MAFLDEFKTDFLTGYSVGQAYGNAGVGVVSDIFNAPQSNRYFETQEMPVLYSDPVVNEPFGARSDTFGLVLAGVAVIALVMIAKES